jgi:class 3 adenylate cyclase
MEGTFCFVDLAGFTALTEAHGAETAADLVGRFTALVRNTLGSHGRFIERIGDAAFAVCPTADDGVAFVTQLFGEAAREADFPALRAGLHHGEALERDGSFYGATVNLAARVAAQAGGSQVLATAHVADAARRRGLVVESLGIIALRNIRTPVELFVLNTRTAEQGIAIDPVCRMRVQPSKAAGRLSHEGVDYWFCSLDCASEFAHDPAAFITA